MALNSIGTVIKKGNEGDDTPWGSIGSLAGTGLGALIGGVGAGAMSGGMGAGAGAMAGASLGGMAGSIGGSVGQAKLADKPTADQAINPIKSSPLSTFSDRSPEVAVAQLKRAQMALNESGLPADQRDAYNKMMQDAISRSSGMA